MSREIKFRGWYMPFGSKDPVQEMLHRRASSILSFTEMNPDAYIVEEFTGLKDKNGKEIYEGDVLYFESVWCVGDEYDPREEEHTGFVKYRPDCASYVVNCNGKIYPLEELTSFDGYSVQGNVHENPELLEEQH